MAGEVRHGRDEQGQAMRRKARSRLAGMARRGNARRGAARRYQAWQALKGADWYGRVRLLKVGRGVDWRGTHRQAW